MLTDVVSSGGKAIQVTERSWGHSKHASFCLICYGGVQIVTLLSARRQGSGVKSVGNGVVCGFTLPRSDKLKDRKDDGLLTRHVLSEFAMVL